MKFLIVLFFALPAFADQPVNGGGEGNAPKASSVDARAANPACLSAQTVTQFSRMSAVNRLVREPKPKGLKKGLSLRAVRVALEKHGLVKSQEDLIEAAEVGGETDDLTAESDKAETPAKQVKAGRPLNARDSSNWLESNGYVNLSDCPEWQTALKDPKKVPKGAVVVYRHPRNDKHPGHIEIKTPSGFWSDRPRNVQEYSPGLEIVGVFVRPNI